MVKQRAAAYIRVSTDSAGQTHSYEFQEQYWRNRFVDDDKIELVALYADKGISGSNIKKRPQFLTMMQDAREHRFDVIYTKSVSRFARNTVELLEAVRELRDIGIEVIFEKEQIHTFQPTSELFLTIAAAIAENDLQVDGDRQRWSIKHRIENGWISIGNGMFGYRMVENNQLEIVPEEAEIVREIYRRYIAGEGSSKLAAWLNETGVKSHTGKPWRQAGVLGIIRNEKYKGDTLMMKKVKRNGKMLRNTDGKYSQQYYIEDSHEGIVSKEIWEKAQEVLRQRNQGREKKQNPVYPFTGIVVCSSCGNHYRHKINNSGKKWQSGIWSCALKLRQGKKACQNTQIKDSVLQEKFIECYNEFIRLRPEGHTITKLQKEMDALYGSERELAKLQQQHLVSDSIFSTEQGKIKKKIKILMERIASQRSKMITEGDYVEIKKFDADKVEKFITKVKVSPNTLTFVFYNGVEISRTYTNGQPGNKKGWNKKEEKIWQ